MATSTPSWSSSWWRRRSKAATDSLSWSGNDPWWPRLVATTRRWSMKSRSIWKLTWPWWSRRLVRPRTSRYRGAFHQWLRGAVVASLTLPTIWAHRVQGGLGRLPGLQRKLGQLGSRGGGGGWDHAGGPPGAQLPGWRTTPTWSTKHQLQSWPGSSERAIGWLSCRAWRWRRGCSGPGCVALGFHHRPFQPIACLLPLLQAAGEASKVPVAVAFEELIQRDAGHAGGVGAVDDDLVVLAELPEGLLGRGKVQRSRDVGCLVLPVTQGVHELQGIATVQLVLDRLRGDQSHGHPSSRIDEGERELMQVETDRHPHRSVLAVARAAPRVASS